MYVYIYIYIEREREVYVACGPVAVYETGPPDSLVHASLTIIGAVHSEVTNDSNDINSSTTTQIIH